MVITRRLKPRTAVHLDWRGGQVWAINAPNATIRLMADAGFIRNKTVPTSLLPSGAIVGDACVCRISGTGADDYTITEVRSSVFIDSPGTDQPAAWRAESSRRAASHPTKTRAAGIRIPIEGKKCTKTIRSHVAHLHGLSKALGHSTGQMAWFTQKGLSVPKRCPDCRRSRREAATQQIERHN
jgi:hypothetical protein